MQYASAFSNLSDPPIDFKMHHRFNDSFPGGERMRLPLIMYKTSPKFRTVKTWERQSRAYHI